MDHTKEWQRLTRLYAEKSDEELFEVINQFGDLTEIAQQVLRDELKRRSLPEPDAEASSPLRSKNSAAAPGKRESTFGDSVTDPILSDESETDPDEQPPVDYTWKVVLCECNEREDAADVMTVLEAAGIRSWYDGREGANSWVTYGPRVVVAADDLERARAVMEKPIPQEVRDENRTKVADFAPPACAHCGDPDPLLTGVDPSNTWQCEACGHCWTESLSSKN